MRFEWFVARRYLRSPHRPAVLLLGSALLPFCVLLELRYGFLAGGLADFGGLLVVVPLLAMWIGILRRTGQWDAAASQPRRGIPA